MYEAYLGMEGIEHSEVAFAKFLMEYGRNICPGHGNITHVNGEVKCNVHMLDDVEEGFDGDVPYL